MYEYAGRIYVYLFGRMERFDMRKRYWWLCWSMQKRCNMHRFGKRLSLCLRQRFHGYVAHSQVLSLSRNIGVFCFFYILSFYKRATLRFALSFSQSLYPSIFRCIYLFIYHLVCNFDSSDGLASIDKYLFFLLHQIIIQISKILWESFFLCIIQFLLLHLRWGCQFVRLQRYARAHTHTTITLYSVCVLCCALN